jgi:hypothetical protein
MTFKPKNCERCGAVYEPHTNSAKYCSDSCRQLAARDCDAKSREKHREKRRIRQAQYYKDHWEEAQKSVAKYYIKNREKLRERAAQRYIDNRETRLKVAAQYRTNNPEKVRANNHKRRLQVRGNGGTHTGQDEIDLLNAQDCRCFYCNTLLYTSLDPRTRHIEHIMGPKNGGSNDPFNIVYACAKCNHIKRGLADSADALLMEHIANGKLSGSEAFQKASTLKMMRERQTNVIIFRHKLREEYRR